MKVSPQMAAKCLALAGVERQAMHAWIPHPPSTNHLFATVNGRRVKTGVYKAWQKKAVSVLLHLRPPESLPCRVVMLVYGKLNPARDLDNMVKPALDALVAAGVLPADNVTAVRRCEIEYVGETADNESEMLVCLKPHAPLERGV
jgi:Holliday junction resolvase RusA-like endonuclease